MFHTPAGNDTTVKERITDEKSVAVCNILNVYPKPVAIKWILLNGLLKNEFFWLTSFCNLSVYRRLIKLTIEYHVVHNKKKISQLKDS